MDSGAGHPDPLPQRLRALGLNRYEARAYLALLGAAGVTAYELGKRSGIPLSRCYEVARSLAAKGLALTQPGRTPRYRAVDPAVAVTRRRAALQGELDGLEAALMSHVAQRQVREEDPVWVLRGRDVIVHHATAMVDTAAAGVLVCTSALTLPELDAALVRARERGVDVLAIHWDVRPLVPRPASSSREGHSSPEHRCSPTNSAAGGAGNGALLVLCDAAEALLGDVGTGDGCLATHTKQPALVQLLAGLLAPAVAQRPGAAPTVPPQLEGSGPEAEGARWLAWEEAKARRLLQRLADWEAELRSVGPPGRLTAREREVAALIARGLTNREIAAQLAITDGTVGAHVTNILNRLGLSSRAQVAAWLVAHDLSTAL